jgi:hypothetical protein
MNLQSLQTMRSYKVIGISDKYVLQKTRENN